ncbi:MAG: DUF3048 domain-containing protein [Chloroflexi bacterium]|nr:DUF3048 domain-containing protein [Chloroflexota bacterium]
MRRALALVLALLTLVSCVSEPAAVAEPPSTSAAPTPEPTDRPFTPEAKPMACAECWPLMGKPLGNGNATRRPLVVKVDNAPAARPPIGLGQADIVFETLVEGFVTRIAAIFHSQEPAQIAPVRSARLTDRSIAPMVRGALVYSGTSAYAEPLIQRDAAQGRYLDLNASYTGGYGRIASRPAPSNVVTTTAAMREAIRQADTRPVQVPRWSFIADARNPRLGGMFGSDTATELVIPYREDSVKVTYTWGEASAGYLRAQNVAGRPVRTIDALDNKPIVVANVIILYTDIIPAPQIVDSTGAISYDARLTGTGRADVIRGGLRQVATWSRANENAAFTFKTVLGEEILLAPGQTWVHPIPADWVVTSR